FCAIATADRRQDTNHPSAEWTYGENTGLRKGSASMKSILALICFAIPPAAAAAGPPSVFIEELTSPEIRDAIAADATTAIYYAGSTEQNGPHMVTGKHNTI